MKLLFAACFVFVLLRTTSSFFFGVCQGGPRTCQIGNTHVSYDSCNRICCGQAITRKRLFLECCGDERNGRPYNTRSQICCVYNNAFRIRNINGRNLECCGLDVFNTALLPDSACCLGPVNPPQVFNRLTEMCCDGALQFAGNTAYTSCCGELAYDRRIASCPCNNGMVVLLPERDGYSDCCANINPYNPMTHSCCGVTPYRIADQFCCGGIVGNQTIEVCCGDQNQNPVITPINPSLTGSRIGCCLLADGRYQTYNTSTSTCCGDQVQPLDTSIDQICCNGTLYDTLLNGTQCCRGVPYHPATHVCCRKALGLGDACCFTLPFHTQGNTICCRGGIENGDTCCGSFGYFNDGSQFCCANRLTNSSNLVIPACCVTVVYDSYTHTCCGSTVFPNPSLPGIGVSHTTRCSSNLGFSPALRPYDYIRQLSCPGGIVNLNGAPADTSGCCGSSFVDLSIQLCCNDNIFNNPFGSRGLCCGGGVVDSANIICCNDVPLDRSRFVCCGNTFADITTERCCFDVVTPLNAIPFDQSLCCGAGVIDRRTTLCCDGVARQRNVGAMCCGQDVFDPSQDKCCDGVVRSLDGIDPRIAICCGDRCIDSGLFWCCNGQQYLRSNPDSDGESIGSPTCQDLLILG